MKTTLPIVAGAVLAALALSPAAHARFDDNDQACSYRETTAKVTTNNIGRTVQRFAGKATCRNANSGLHGFLFPSSNFQVEYEGSYNEATTETTETIQAMSMTFAASARCAVNPWTQQESNSKNGFRFVPACTNVNFTGQWPYGPADRFPFMARYGGVPFGMRKQLIDEQLAAIQASANGQVSFSAPNRPSGVQATVLRLPKGRVGSVLWQLPKVGQGQWVDRFEVELAFVPNRHDTDPSQANWLPDGSAPGRTTPMTSTTDPNQYYDTVKKDYYDGTDYWFRVCSVNNVGRACAQPVKAVFETPRGTARAMPRPSRSDAAAAPLLNPAATQGKGSLTWGDATAPKAAQRAPMGATGALATTPGIGAAAPGAVAPVPPAAGASGPPLPAVGGGAAGRAPSAAPAVLRPGAAAALPQARSSLPAQERP